MAGGEDNVAAWCLTFRMLFDSRLAQVALLDQQGRILATNKSWREYGRANGLSANYECVGQNYLQACEKAAVQNWPGAREACIGLLAVLHAQRPKFTMVYPCQTPLERQWYRMWVEPQLPAVPAVVVAHYRCRGSAPADPAAESSFGIMQAMGGGGYSAMAELPRCSKNNVWIPAHCR